MMRIYFFVGLDTDSVLHANPGRKVLNTYIYISIAVLSSELLHPVQLIPLSVSLILLFLILTPLIEMSRRIQIHLQ